MAIKPGIDRFGVNRVIVPTVPFPYNAPKLNPKLPLGRSEALISGQLALNIDSASFHQISEACGGDATRIGAHVKAICFQMPYD